MAVIKVSFTTDEYDWAMAIAEERYSEAGKGRMWNAHGLPHERQGVTLDKWGACAELAAALGLKMEWPARVNNFKGADLGDDIQVRGITSRNHKLIVRKDDDSKHKYVLVFSKDFYDHAVIGWIRGFDAKRKGWWMSPANRPGAYFVPQNELLSFPISD